jgi:archaellum component FlaC
MTIDERLERLTERHEALTQSVELMALENKERDRRLAVENKERDKRLEQRDQRLDKILNQMAEGIARLLHIAEIHEQRLDDLERKQ